MARWFASGGGGISAVPSNAVRRIVVSESSGEELIDGDLLLVVAPREVDPLDISGMVLWYDAQAITAADGDSLTTIADQSGSARNATKISTPAAVYEATGINGHPSVYFSAAGRYYHTGTFPALSGIATVFVVAHWTSTGGAMIIDGTAYGSQMALGRHSTNNVWRMNRNSLVSSGTGTSDNVSPHLLRAVFGVAGGSSLHVDGVSVLSGANVGSGAPTLLRVGADPDGNAGFIGHLGELVIFNRALTLAETADMEAYLTAKWDL